MISIHVVRWYSAISYEYWYVFLDIRTFLHIFTDSGHFLSVGVKTCWASSNSSGAIIRDEDGDGEDDDSGAFDLDLTGGGGLYEILAFYSDFCPAFSWVFPNIPESPLTDEEDLAENLWKYLVPSDRKGNHNVYLRQFMFNGLPTIYYHCDVSIKIKNLD